MSDPVEVIAKAICRHSCSVTMCGPGDSCWDWEAVVPEARAALSALEKEGYVIVLRGEIEEAKQDAWERGRDYSGTER